jgi:ubiquinone/menaquinone biosynthesis C-methylase UbiE
MDLKESGSLDFDELEHWYYKSKGLAIRAMLHGCRGRVVMDVGAGTGVFSKQLLDAKMYKQAICVDPGYTKNSKLKYAEGEIGFYQVNPGSYQDLTIMVDVIEHVEDDFSFLQEYVRQMPRGTLLLVTVPAFQMLWSDHDRFLGHYRRYSLTQIVALAHSAGLEVVDKRYYFAALFPFVAMVRWLKSKCLAQEKDIEGSDMKSHSVVINKVLYWLHWIELKTFFKVNRWFGLTAMLLCKKV